MAEDWLLTGIGKTGDDSAIELKNRMINLEETLKTTKLNLKKDELDLMNKYLTEKQMKIFKLLYGVQVLILDDGVTFKGIYRKKVENMVKEHLKSF